MRDRGAPRSFCTFANHGDDKPQVEGSLPVDHARAPKCECRDVSDEAYYDGRVAAEAVRVLGEVKDQTVFSRDRFLEASRAVQCATEILEDVRAFKGTGVRFQSTNRST